MDNHNNTKTQQSNLTGEGKNPSNSFYFKIAMAPFSLLTRSVRSSFLFKKKMFVRVCDLPIIDSEISSSRSAEETHQILERFTTLFVQKKKKIPLHYRQR
jgi:hypothetical protein